MKRDRRREHQQETRTELLQAAAELFAQKGFRATSVEQVAAKAGYSTGAVYSNFRGKDDLFLALFKQRIEQRRGDIETAADSGLPASEQAERIGQQFAAVLQQDREWFLLFFEFWLHAARDERFRARFLEQHRAAQQSLAALVKARADAHGRLTPTAPGDVAIRLTAASYGLALERLLDPDGVTADQVVGLLSMIALDEPPVEPPTT